MRLLVLIPALCVSTLALAEDSTITITTGKQKVLKESEKRQNKEFCSKTSGEDAKAQCELWMAEQKKTLDKRFLTSYCSFGKGTTRTDGCMYASEGELVYILRLCNED